MSKILDIVHKTPSHVEPLSNFDVEACDALLVKYATRALEFPVLMEAQDSMGIYEYYW